MSLLVVGSIAYDSIETSLGKVENVLGGSSIHFSAASSFFTPTSIVGVVGEDFRKEELQFLIDRGADITGIVVEPGKTFRWSGKYHNNMNERDTLSTELNVFERFRPNIPSRLLGSDYLFLANIHPALQMEVLNKVTNPAFTVLDTMNFWIEGSHTELTDVLKKVDAVILNDTEAQQFSGEYNLARAAKTISRYGPHAVVIKKGEHGSLMYHEGTFFALPAYILETVIDPTGAGDSFAGGFMGYIARKRSTDTSTLRAAMAYGTCAASFCCEDFGTKRLANLVKQELTNRFESFKQLITIATKNS